MKRDNTTSFKNNTASGYKLSSVAPVVRDTCTLGSEHKYF